MGNTQSQTLSQMFQDQLKDWKQVKERQKLCFVNKISGDKFRVYNNVITDQKLLKHRSIYSFQGTPKIIFMKQNLDPIILIQEPVSTLNHLLSKLRISIVALLCCIKKILATLQNLKDKYGCFYLTEQMIKVGANDNIIIWINSKWELNQRQFPLPENEGEDIMLEKIWKIFKQYADLFKYSVHPKNISEAIKQTDQQINKQSLKGTKSTSNSSLMSPKSQFYRIQQTPYKKKNNLTFTTSPLTIATKNPEHNTQYTYTTRQNVNNSGSQYLLFNRTNSRSLNPEIQANLRPKTPLIYQSRKNFVNAPLPIDKVSNVQDSLTYSPDPKKKQKKQSFLKIYDCSQGQQKQINDYEQSRSSGITSKTKQKISNQRKIHYIQSQNSSLQNNSNQFVQQQSSAILIKCQSKQSNQSNELTSPVKRKIAQQITQLFS